MAGFTNNYGLVKLQGGESFAFNGYQFIDRDRETIDQKLWLGAEGHRHTGESGGIEPSGPPSLELDTTQGNLPSGVRIGYRISYVNERGEESAASTEEIIDTPAGVSAPQGATLVVRPGDGLLPPGTYYYTLSAYTDYSTSETTAPNQSFITVQSADGPSMIELELPPLPAGATGFNIYRRGPGQGKLYWLTSLDMSGFPGPTFEDDGTLQEDCDRTVPSANTTNSSNSVVITLPGATPGMDLDMGYTWRVYRTYTPGVYGPNSLMAHVVETTTEESGIVVGSIQDVGAATTAGMPRDSSGYSNSPSKIVPEFEMEPGIPVGYIMHPRVERIEIPGAVEARMNAKSILLGPSVSDPGWFVQSRGMVYAVRLSLPFEVTPAAQPIQVQVNAIKHTPQWNGSAYEWVATAYPLFDQPIELDVGQYMSPVYVPDTGQEELGSNTYISIDILQSGGGATPTDYDLTVHVMYVVEFPYMTYLPHSLEYEYSNMVF